MLCKYDLLLLSKFVTQKVGVTRRNQRSGPKGKSRGPCMVSRAFIPSVENIIPSLLVGRIHVEDVRVESGPGRARREGRQMGSEKNIGESGLFSSVMVIRLEKALC